VLTVDFHSSGDVAHWELTDDGVTRTVHGEYTPTLFVGDAVRDLYGRRGGPTPTPPDRDGLSDSLTELQAFLTGQDAVSTHSVNPIGKHSGQIRGRFSGSTRPA